MIQALAFGGAAALIWGATALTSAPAARLAGPWRAMLWMSLAAAVLTALAALPTGTPGGDASDWSLVVAAGVAYTASTAFWLSAVRGGHVSLITPIIACDGALAAVLAVTTGEPLSSAAAVALGAMVFALILVARDEAAPATVSEARFTFTVERPLRITVLLAVLTAVSFAIVFFTSGKISGIHPLWVVAAARTFPCVYALAVSRREGPLLPPDGTWRWILACGITDALAYVAYLYAARGVLAVAAVAASQYAAAAAIGGVWLLGERLVRRQWFGIAMLIAAAAVIASQGSG
jgi:drug/metabolite transporter (DMT)-like permease